MPHWHRGAENPTTQVTTRSRRFPSCRDRRSLASSCRAYRGHWSDAALLDLMPPSRGGPRPCRARIHPFHPAASKPSAIATRAVNPQNSGRPKEGSTTSRRLAHCLESRKAPLAGQLAPRPRTIRHHLVRLGRRGRRFLRESGLQVDDAFEPRSPRRRRPGQRDLSRRGCTSIPMVPSLPEVARRVLVHLQSLSYLLILPDGLPMSGSPRVVYTFHLSLNEKSSSPPGGGGWVW
jgi:hypothetical protein